MKKNLLLLTILSALLSSCFKGESVDLIIHNAVIHTMNESNDIVEAIAIKDGKVVEVGAERQILNRYTADETIDAQGKEIYPGLTDAHGHLLSLAIQKLGVELFGVKSMDELLVKTEKYQDRNQRKYIVGRGWDQSLWGGDVLPNNDRLNKLFPTTPVCLYRVDGHALLANEAALKLAKVTPESKFTGGIVHVVDGKCTGLLVDNAMEAVNATVPAYTDEELISTIVEIQNELLQYGITAVHEAGLERSDIDLFHKMVDQKKLTIEVYGMLLNSPENKAFVKKNGQVNWGSFYIRSFKMYGDGALGSRGALLKKPYTDEHNHYGVLTTPVDEMGTLADFCIQNKYQLNSHAIGDSTNAILLNLYKKAQAADKDHRWRIEHAQVVDPKDFSLFAEYGVFPSVQPTHAVSDQRWAENRLGTERLKGAYAYQTLLKQAGMLAIGTDFPVEQINPFLTIHAATSRKNQENFPSAGFLPSEAISLLDCMKGMTIWAAYACFREKETGSLEKGKDATLALFDKTIAKRESFVENFALLTVVRGKKVYNVLD